MWRSLDYKYLKSSLSKTEFFEWRIGCYSSMDIDYSVIGTKRIMHLLSIHLFVCQNFGFDYFMLKFDRIEVIGSLSKEVSLSGRFVYKI